MYRERVFSGFYLRQLQLRDSGRFAQHLPRLLHIKIVRCHAYKAHASYEAVLMQVDRQQSHVIVLRAVAGKV